MLRVGIRLDGYVACGVSRCLINVYIRWWHAEVNEISLKSSEVDLPARGHNASQANQV